jgi:hypothetical protein
VTLTAGLIKEAAVEPATTDRIQRMIDAEATERFPPGAVPQFALLHYGDHPMIEPGDLLVRVFIEEAEEAPPLPAWNRDHETMIRELQREPALGLTQPWSCAAGAAGQPLAARWCG